MVGVTVVTSVSVVVYAEGWMHADADDLLGQDISVEEAA